MISRLQRSIWPIGLPPITWAGILAGGFANRWFASAAGLYYGGLVGALTCKPNSTTLDLNP